MRFKKIRNPELNWDDYIETQNLRFALNKVMGHHEKMISTLR